MGRKSYATPFKTSKATKRMYSRAAGCLMAPLVGLSKGIKKSRGKSRRRG